MLATSPAKEDDEPEVNASESQSLVPSSMGLTICVPEDEEAVEAAVSWGRYVRSKSEATGRCCWKRITVMAGGKVTLKLTEGPLTPCTVGDAVPEVRLQGSVSRPVGQGDRLVTLFLVNGQTEPQQNRDHAWVFQPEIVVRDGTGGAVFRRRPLLDVEQHDEERLSLEMIYRRRVEFATGHGTSVHAVVSASDPELATEVRTTVIPDQEIQITEAPGADSADRAALRELREHGWLDMEKLADSAELSDDELLSALTVLTGDYEGWIAENRAAIGVTVEGYDAQAQEAMERCELILERLKEGISTLRLNTDAMSAFRFANRAMAQQRVRGIYARKRRQGEAVTADELNIPANRTWHPFQLAFLLLSVPALADPEHADRTEPLAAYADLLWFPTGGGKTEAYGLWPADHPRFSAETTPPTAVASFSGAVEKEMIPSIA